MSTQNRRNPPAKWVLPDVINPPDHICFKIPVPNNPYYIAAFRGALLNLCSARQWGDDPAHTALLVAKVWQGIYDQVVATACETPVLFPNFGEDDENMPALYEPYCRDDGTCGFHFRCDICGDWHDVATAADVGSSTSPGAGSPQPGPNGGVISVCKKLQANGYLLLDAPVSTGDTVTIISASGSGNDGGELQWRCPDGGTYFGGLCDDPAISLMGGDPVPTSPHMSLILTIGGTGYPFYLGASPWTPVVITIPGGISNAYAEIQVNDSALGNNKGDYAICYEQKNNQTGTWTHTIDFTATSGGFNTTGIGVNGTWIPGVGWQSTFTGPSSDEVLISRTFPAISGGSYTYYEVFYTASVIGQLYTDFGAGSDGPIANAIGSHSHVVGYSLPNGGLVDAEMRLTTAITGGEFTITKMIFKGTGIDPL